MVAIAYDEKTSTERIRTDAIEHTIILIYRKYRLKIPAYANIVINGTGLWHKPGPESEAGLTGHKIVVDGYSVLLA